ncbi:hypothetical protein ASG43_07830 [Aureimonas sp. Leaf454]|nr:hypothetical protein ASG43_07830 [Aureimonas sp. Leaf454]
MEASNDNSPVGDLLVGANAIAAFLGCTRRQAYRFVYDGLLPSFKLGGTVAARRSTLTRWMADRETGGMKVSA